MGEIKGMEEGQKRRQNEKKRNFEIDVVKWRYNTQHNDTLFNDTWHNGREREILGNDFRDLFKGKRTLSIVTFRKMTLRIITRSKITLRIWLM